VSAEEPFNIANLFEVVADAIPDREALVCADTRLTFAQLDERTNQLAHWLASRGIGAGDHVGIYMPNAAEYVETMLAAFKVRAVPININFRYVEEELRYLFTDADLKAVVCGRSYLPLVEAVRGDCPQLAEVIVVDDGDDSPLGDAVIYEDAVAAGSPERDFAPRDDGDIYIIYTGGTTGMPKGVMWRHEDIFYAGLAGGNPAGADVYDYATLAQNARDKYLMTMFPVAPLIHGAAQLATFIGLLTGDRVVLLPKFSGEGVVGMIADEKVNTMSIVGDAMARPIVEALEANAALPENERLDVSSLFVVSSAGAIFTTPVKDRMKAQLPNTLLLDNYGSTETGYQGTGNESERSSFGAGLAFNLNDRSVVLDDDHNVVQPGSGVMGHVALRRHVPVGYYNDPEKSAKTFVQIDGERYSITGDLATVEADGTIKVFGRGSQCINTGGEKVFIEEVENALRDHPAVADAVVVGIPDERFGERVASLVELEPGVTATTDDIDAHTRTKVAGYKVPRDIFFVDAVFRGPNGKADYKLSKQIATDLANAGS
jgi:acyl-CoA synthetase (AMP-forming)/AMP-acid ligase II